MAALTHIAGYILYNVQAKLGSSEPNPVSWFLWAFLATLNGPTFTAMNDPISALQFLAGSVGYIATFLYVLFIGKFRWPKPMEWGMFAVGIFVALVWKVSDPGIANMVLAIAIAWSFIPTIIGVWRDPRKEKATPWWFWTTAFTMTAVYIVATKGWWTPSLIMPVLLLLCHAVVPFLASKHRTQVWIARKEEELKSQERWCAYLKASYLSSLRNQLWFYAEEDRKRFEPARAECVRLRKLLGMW